MRKRTRTALEKMRNYAQKVIYYTQEMDYMTFSNDTKTLEACVFNLSQIGELVQYLDPSFKQEHIKINWQGVKGLRNRIVHDYEGLQVNIIWHLIVEDLPELFKLIETVLKENKY
ncbi:MAG: DUF86 domain-containing protein [Caldisericia bacterium]|nr:DUF86 domain-containing protein [Caldisericia bacterium]